MPPAKNVTVPDAAPEERWVYIGRRVDKKNRVVYAYLKSDGEDIASYVKPITPSKVIGGVYAIRQTADRKSALISKDPKSYHGPSNHPDITEWRIEDETAMARKEMQRLAEADEAGESVLLDMTLKEIKKQVAFLPSFKRRAIVATVIELLYGRAAV